MARSKQVERYVAAYVEMKLAQAKPELGTDAMTYLYASQARDVISTVLPLIESDVRARQAWSIVDELQDIGAPREVTGHIKQKYYDPDADPATQSEKA